MLKDRERSRVTAGQPLGLEANSGKVDVPRGALELEWPPCGCSWGSGLVSMRAPLWGKSAPQEAMAGEPEAVPSLQLGCTAFSPGGWASSCPLLTHPGKCSAPSSIPCNLILHCCSLLRLRHIWQPVCHSCCPCAFMAGSHDIDKLAPDLT